MSQYEKSIKQPPAANNRPKKELFTMYYETYHTPSWDIEKAKDHHEGKTYNCDFCGVSLEDWEVYLVNGKAFCGCCK
jgi:hypothetical protein